MSDTSDDLKAAARITVAFLTLYAFTFWNVLVTKKRMLQQHSEQKSKDNGNDNGRINKAYDRYTSPGMHTADRLQMNFLEWSPIFLGLLWSLGATGNLSPSFAATTAAWTYVGLRLLYIVLIFRHGIDARGFQQKLWIATFPAYFCLLVMFLQAIFALYLS